MSFESLKYLAVANWVSDSFPIIRVVLLILVAVMSLALIFVVLFQPGNDGNFGALTGSSTETYFSKNKSQTRESLLKRLTVILGIAIAVLAVLFFVTVAIYNGN